MSEKEEIKSTKLLKAQLKNRNAIMRPNRALTEKIGKLRKRVRESGIKSRNRREYPKLTKPFLLDYFCLEKIERDDPKCEKCDEFLDYHEIEGLKTYWQCPKCKNVENIKLW